LAGIVVTLAAIILRLVNITFPDVAFKAMRKQYIGHTAKAIDILRFNSGVEHFTPTFSSLSPKPVVIIPCCDISVAAAAFKSAAGYHFIHTIPPLLIYDNIILEHMFAVNGKSKIIRFGFSIIIVQAPESK